MERHASAMKAVRTAALFGLAGLAAAGAVWFFVFGASRPAPRPRADVVAVERRGAVANGVAPAQAVPNATSLPASLDGSSPPRLPLDIHGHLAKARGVRDFFDYFLTARHEMPMQALDMLVRRQIAAQLDGTAAAFDTLDVWQRYTAYLDALDRLSPLAASSGAGLLDLNAEQTALDQRASLASRMMGDWSEPFFGAEFRHQRYAIARLRVTTDATLTDTQKAARLQALEQGLPAEERAALERERQARASIETIALLQKQGASPDEMRARVTQALGPAAAARVVSMQQGEDAWRAKYSEYAAQRSQIDAMGLPPAERAAQVAQLRQRAFTNPGEAVRAASLDSAAGD